MKRVLSVLAACLDSQEHPNLFIVSGDVSMLHHYLIRFNTSAGEFHINRRREYESQTGYADFFLLSLSFPFLLFQSGKWNCTVTGKCIN